jgi:hypothetical protein
MADGSHKPIRDVVKGDKVLASDPVSGRTETRAVTDTIVGEGEKDLVDVSVTVAGGATATVVATGKHPFWVDDQGRWVDAEDLVAGDTLLTPAGDRVQVAGTRSHHEITRVHNLTVDAIHTYYVAAGTKDLLVHNCGEVGLPDEALVVRGGTNTAERFANGSGVTVDAAGSLNGVSVNSAAGKSLTELSQGIPNGQVGVTTVGQVRAAGGEVIASPTRSNALHCTLSGITAEVASELFTPTVRNPCR